MSGVKGVKRLKGISAVIATILMLVITIALAGTAYFYISGIFTTQTQGIEVADAFCNSNNQTTFVIRNLGTNPVISVTCVQTGPSTDTTCSPGFTGVNIAPGQTQTFSNADTCTGTQSRFCQYRFSPSTGRTIQTQVSCG